MSSATVPNEDCLDTSIGVADFLSNNPGARSVRAWDISVYTEDYRVLEPVWRNLEAQGCCTAFQSYDWVSCWYETALSSGQARPLVVTVSEEGGGVVWILPLCLHRKGSVRVISFADLGISDYIAPVMARNAPADTKTARDIATAVFKALPPCDVVHFQKITEKAGDRGNPLAHLRGVRPFHAGCHGIHLSEPWPELSGKVMQSRLRSTIRRKKKQIQREGAVSFEYHECHKTIGSVFDRLMVMRKNRLSKIDRPDLPEPWQNFYYALVSRKKQSLGVSVATMTVQGQEVAACFGLTYGKTYYAILPAFQMGRWESYRPGLLLFDEILTRFYGQKEYFDLTVGDEIYKKHLGCKRHPLYEWMSPRSFRGLVFYGHWRIKEILRKHPCLFDRLKKVQQFLICGKRG